MASFLDTMLNVEPESTVIAQQSTQSTNSSVLVTIPTLNSHSALAKYRSSRTQKHVTIKIILCCYALQAGRVHFMFS